MKIRGTASPYSFRSLKKEENPGTGLNHIRSEVYINGGESGDQPHHICLEVQKNRGKSGDRPHHIRSEVYIVPNS
jgi:hypothetical protein